MSFKVTYDTSQLASLSREARKSINQILKEKTFQDQITKDVKQDIIATTRLGKSTVTGKSFPRLKPKWISTRAKIIAFQGAPSFVKASKSNLSLSGELLDSLKSRVSDTDGFKAAFFFEGVHRPYKYRGVLKPVVKVGGGIENDKLAKILDKRFKFIGIRPILQKRIITSIVDKIKVTLARLNRRR